VLIDNKKNGKVGDILKQNIKAGSRISIILAYFTIYAFSKLKKELLNIEELKLLFTTPIYQNNYINNPIFGVDEEIIFKNSMQQVSIAKECANWIKEKVQIKEVKTQGIIPFNLYHINNKKKFYSYTGKFKFLFNWFRIYTL
jgi:hypothetical protein